MSVACRGRRSRLPALSFTLVWCLAALLSACAARAVALSPATLRDTIWYASARARVDGRDVRRQADTLEYGAAVYDRTNVRDPFTSSIALTLRDSLRLTRELFLAALTDRVVAPADSDQFAMVYVHGFGTGLGECWSNPLQAHIRSGSTAPWIAFCWPSHGSGITWPREGSLLVRAYEDDTSAVMRSAPLFRELLQDLTGAVGASRVVLAAHSLGARLVGATLSEIVPPNTISSNPGGHSPQPGFRAVAFMAPDLDATRFADTLVPQLRQRASRIVLYSSRRDRALTISRRMHDTPRAGLAEPTPLLRDGLETVDMTDALNADGWWQRHFGNRHSIRRPSGAMWDLVHVVGGRLAPSCRANLGYGVHEPSGVWRLLSGHYPDTSRSSACDRYTSSVDTSAAHHRDIPQ